MTNRQRPLDRRLEQEQIEDRLGSLIINGAEKNPGIRGIHHQEKIKIIIEVKLYFDEFF